MPAGQQILLSRAAAGRVRLAHDDLVKVTAHFFQVLIETLPLEHLDQKITTRLEHLQRQIQRQFTQIHRASLISRPRSEEHTSELQSRPHLVCRLLLEKKN